MGNSLFCGENCINLCARGNRQHIFQNIIRTDSTPVTGGFYAR